MSVILDSLRRARGAAPPPAAEPAAPHTPRPVPERLRGEPAREETPPPRRLRPAVVMAVVGVAFGIWAVVQLSLRVLAPDVAPTPTYDLTVAGRVEPPGADAAGGTGPAAAPEAQPPPPPPPAPAPAAQESAQSPVPPVARPRRSAAVPRPVNPEPVPSTPVAPSPLPRTPPAVAATASAPPQGSFELAVKYQEAGNFEQAIVQYLALLERDPFNAQARNNLGMLYRGRGARDEAMKQLLLAVKGNPQYLTARRNLAVVYLEAGRLIEARVELNAALRIDPRNVDTLVNMAIVEMKAEHPEVAKETLLKALAFDSKHALAHYNLALLYEEGGELARAHHHYSEFLRHAHPEYTTELVNVQAKVEALTLKLFPSGR